MCCSLFAPSAHSSPENLLTCHAYYQLDLKDATLVGHSTGGEAARYIGRHGTKRVAKVVLAAAVPPIMLKSAANPEGLPMEVFDNLRSGITKDLAPMFYGSNRPGARVSQGILDQF